MNPIIKIDGEVFEYTDFYPVKNCGGGTQSGGIVGENETTKAEYKVRCIVANKIIYAINIYNRKSDGSIDGIKGIYRNGKWSKDKNGNVVFSVSDRLA